MQRPISAILAFGYCYSHQRILILCRGAAEGEGLGNAFLSHIQAVDGIFHVCRGFEDADVTHVEDRVDPVEDLEIIHKYVLHPQIFHVHVLCSSVLTDSRVKVVDRITDLLTSACQSTCWSMKLIMNSALQALP